MNKSWAVAAVLAGEGTCDAQNIAMHFGIAIDEITVAAPTRGGFVVRRSVLRPTREKLPQAKLTQDVIGQGWLAQDGGVGEIDGHRLRPGMREE